jgi:hypothetical protein
VTFVSAAVGVLATGLDVQDATVIPTAVKIIAASGLPFMADPMVIDETV